MPKAYNEIYSKLVEDDNDIVGHVAYSIYKRQKIDYIDDLKQKGITVTDSDLEHFHRVTLTDTNINSYNLQANSVLNNFIGNILSEEIKQIEDNLKKEQEETLREVVENLTPSFWVSVLSGVVSAFFFAGILALIVFIIRFSNYEIEFLTVKEKSKTEDTNTSTIKSSTNIHKP